MKMYKVTLTLEEQQEHDALSSKGKHAAQTVLNALILLACNEGKYRKEGSINDTIARVLNVSMKNDRPGKKAICRRVYG